MREGWYWEKEEKRNVDFAEVIESRGSMCGRSVEIEEGEGRVGGSGSVDIRGGGGEK